MKDIIKELQTNVYVSSLFLESVVCGVKFNRLIRDNTELVRLLFYKITQFYILIKNY